MLLSLLCTKLGILLWVVYCIYQVPVTLTRFISSYLTRFSAIIQTHIAKCSWTIRHDRSSILSFLWPSIFYKISFWVGLINYQVLVMLISYTQIKSGHWLQDVCFILLYHILHHNPDSPICSSNYKSPFHNILFLFFINAKQYMIKLPFLVKLCVHLV